MSRITLAPNASGTGTLTVAAPNTNTDRTLTLPDVTTTLVGTDATQTLTNKSIASSQLTGALPAIDGSALTGLPAPTTAQVGTATAGLAAGAVGSYMFARSSPATSASFGSTFAGSDLLPTSAIYSVTGACAGVSMASGSTQSGTWRAMGEYDYSTPNGTSGSSFGATLWLRIS